MKEEYKVKLIDGNYKLVEEVEDGINRDKEAIFDSSDYTPTLLFSVIVVLLASFSVGLSLGYSSPVQSEIMKELGLSISQYSVFGSIGSIGGGVGSVLCGQLIDYLGRRRMIVLADVFFILGWFFIAISQHVLLYLGRCIIGFAMAICGIVISPYIAEFTPRNSRGGFVILTVLMVPSGVSLTLVMGSFIHWRTLASIGIIPSLVQMICIFFIPESPRWLLPYAVLEEQKDYISQEASDIKVKAEALNQKHKARLSQLFQKKYVYTMTVGIGLSTLPTLVGSGGITAYSGSVFESAGLSATSGNVGIAIIQIPSVILGVFFTDKYGRRPLMMISAAGAFLGCMMTGSAFVLQEHQLLGGFIPYVALIGILVYVAVFPIGLGGVSFVLLSEIYPLNIKGYAGSVTSVLHSFLSWVVAYGFNFAMQWSSSGTFFVFAGICVVTLIFVYRLVPETKGKTLEDIHLQMSNVWQ